MTRLAIFLYGIVCYLMFLATFLYAIGFVGNVLVPKSIDSGSPGTFWPSLLINLGLLGVFGLQHSVMARPGFKRWWTNVVPQSMERSTYVLFSNLALVLLYWQWRPMPGIAWNVQAEMARSILWTVSGLGWGIVLISTFLISHSHLFGLKQVHDCLRQKQPAHATFETPGLYRYMRHPIMTGFFIAFWATPTMTTGHLVFALVTTTYILVALQLEERDLIELFGEQYEAYRRRVPMMFPWIGGKRSGAGD